MTASERGFLLLCCEIGDGMTPLSLYQLEQMRRRMTAARLSFDEDTQITPQVLQKLGYSEKTADRIAALLDREQALDAYLALGKTHGCYPLSCVSDGFPQMLRARLGRRCPAVLFYRGELSLLQNRCIALAGSRRLKTPGARFAERIGALAAKEGYTLVSGNATGADQTAQNACLQHDGSVIAILSEPLSEVPAPDARTLYLSESGWHLPFSAQRALSRNRLIYAMAEKSFVAQCTLGSGTIQGAEDALKHGISMVFVNDDGSNGAQALIRLGAVPVKEAALTSLSALLPPQTSLFED